MRYFSAIGVVVLAAVVAAACKREASSERAGGANWSAAGAASSLREGDLIFQESKSSQSEMVGALTGSRWTHMGVIVLQPTGSFVFEAVSPVKYTPLRDWIRRGRGQRYVVKRLRDADTRLTPEVLAAMRKLGASWLGRPYDLRFRWDDQALYCSELAYKLFERAVGVRLGKLQRAAEMNLDDERVKTALRKRFAGATFDPAETVITPDAMFNDEQLIEIAP